MLKIVAEKVGLRRYYDSLENQIDVAANTQYSMQTYLLMFFSYSVVGWLWEIILFLAVEQQFVNTGMLHGPWLPIYGFGGVLSLELFKNIRHNPLKLFTSICVVAGIMEYATHFATEKIFGVTWWDYSEYLFSINDRVCLEGLAVFGVLGCLSVYILAPKLNQVIRRIDEGYKNKIIFVLGTLFLIDVILSLISPNMNNIYY